MSMFGSIGAFTRGLFQQSGGQMATLEELLAMGGRPLQGPQAPPHQQPQQQPAWDESAFFEQPTAQQASQRPYESMLPSPPPPPRSGIAGLYTVNDLPPLPPMGPPRYTPEGPPELLPPGPEQFQAQMVPIDRMPIVPVQTAVGQYPLPVPDATYDAYQGFGQAQRDFIAPQPFASHQQSWLYGNRKVRRLAKDGFDGDVNAEPAWREGDTFYTLPEEPPSSFAGGDSSDASAALFRTAAELTRNSGDPGPMVRANMLYHAKTPGYAVLEVPNGAVREGLAAATAAQWAFYADPANLNRGLPPDLAAMFDLGDGRMLVSGKAAAAQLQQWQNRHQVFQPGQFGEDQAAMLDAETARLQLDPRPTYLTGAMSPVQQAEFHQAERQRMYRPEPVHHYDEMWDGSLRAMPAAMQKFGANAAGWINEQIAGVSKGFDSYAAANPTLVHYMGAGNVGSTVSGFNHATDPLNLMAPTTTPGQRDDWRDSPVYEAIRDWSDQQRAAADKKLAKFPSSGRSNSNLRNLVNFIGENLPSAVMQLAPTMIASALMGGPAAAVVGGLMEGTGAYGESLDYLAQKNGGKITPKDRQTAMLLALPVALINGALEKTGVEALLEPNNKRAIIRSLLGKAFAEGGTEGMQSLVNQFAYKIAMGKPTDLREVFGEALMGGLVGVGAGGVHMLGDLRSTSPPGTEPGAKPAPITPLSPEDAQDLLDYAAERKLELRAKAQGTPEQIITLPDGRKQVIPAVEPEAMTPAEQRELAFLDQNAANSQTLQQVYRVVSPPQADTTTTKGGPNVQEEGRPQAEVLNRGGAASGEAATPGGPASPQGLNGPMPQSGGSSRTQAPLPDVNSLTIEQARGELTQLNQTVFRLQAFKQPVPAWMDQRIAELRDAVGQKRAAAQARPRREVTRDTRDPVTGPQPPVGPQMPIGPVPVSRAPAPTLTPRVATPNVAGATPDVAPSDPGWIVTNEPGKGYNDAFFNVYPDIKGDASTWEKMQDGETRTVRGESGKFYEIKRGRDDVGRGAIVAYREVPPPSVRPPAVESPAGPPVAPGTSPGVTQTDTPQQPGTPPAPVESPQDRLLLDRKKLALKTMWKVAAGARDAEASRSTSETLPSQPPTEADERSPAEVAGTAVNRAGDIQSPVGRVPAQSSRADSVAPPQKSVKKKTRYTIIPRDWHGRALYNFGGVGLQLKKGERAPGAAGRPVRVLPIEFYNQLGRVDGDAAALLGEIRGLTDEVWKVNGKGGGYFVAPRQAISDARASLAERGVDVEADSRQNRMAREERTRKWRENRADRERKIGGVGDQLIRHFVEETGIYEAGKGQAPADPKNQGTLTDALAWGREQPKDSQGYLLAYLYSKAKQDPAGTTYDWVEPAKLTDGTEILIGRDKLIIEEDPETGEKMLHDGITVRVQEGIVIPAKEVREGELPEVGSADDDILFMPETPDKPAPGASGPITVNGDEIPGFAEAREQNDLKGMRDAASVFFRQNWQGKKVRNLATGQDVELTAGSLKHGLAFRARPDAMAAVAVLDRLIATAEPVSVEPPSSKKQPFVKQVHVWRAALSVDGRQHGVKLTVFEMKSGHMLYQWRLQKDGGSGEYTVSAADAVDGRSAAEPQVNIELSEDAVKNKGGGTQDNAAVQDDLSQATPAGQTGLNLPKKLLGDAPPPETGENPPSAEVQAVRARNAAKKAGRNNIKFSRREGMGISAKDAESAIAHLRSRFPQQITVVQSEAELPSFIRNELNHRNAKPGAMVINDEEVFLIADNLESQDDALVAAWHEIVGHAGIEASLTEPQLRKILKYAQENASDLMAEIRENYEPGDLVNELVAGLSEQFAGQPRPRWYTNLLDVIRLAWKQLTGRSFTHEDVEAVFRRAAKAAEKQKGGMSRMAASIAVSHSSPRDLKFSLRGRDEVFLESEKTLGETFGFPPRDAKMPQAPIKLPLGEQDPNDPHQGYGSAHIEARMAQEGRLPEFADAVAFVDHMTDRPDKIWQLSGDRYVFEKTDGKRRIMRLELRRSGDYYSVVTGYEVRTDENIKGMLIWSRSEPATTGLGSTGSIHGASLPESSAFAQGQETRRFGHTSDNTIDQPHPSVKDNLSQASPAGQTGLNLPKKLLGDAPPLETQGQAEVTDDGEDDGRDPEISAMAISAPPPPNASTVRGKAKLDAGKVISRQEIHDFIVDKLGLAVASGGFRRKVLGFFRRRKPGRIARTKVAQDIWTLAHETGHYLHQLLFSNKTPDPATHGELKALGAATSLPNYSGKQVLDEGIAEFVRHWLIDRNVTMQKAPLYLKTFEARMMQVPAVWKAMHELRGMYAQFLAQDGPQRVRSLINYDGIDPPVRTPMEGPGNAVQRAARRAYYEVFDDLVPLQWMRQDLQGPDPMDPLSKVPKAPTDPVHFAQDAYVLARLTRGIPGKVLGWLHYGVRDKDGKLVSKSMDDVMRTAGVNGKWGFSRGKYKDFNDYLLARRAKELYTQEKAGLRELRKDLRPEQGPLGITEADADDTIAKYDSPAFQRAAQMLYEFNSAVLDQVAADNGYSQQQIDAIKEMNKNYVPMERIMDANDAAHANGGNNLVDRTKWFHRIMGSGRRVQPPIDALIRNMHTLVENAAKNRAAIAAVDTILASDRGGMFLDPITRPMAGTSFELNEIKQALLKSGMDPVALDAMDLDQVATIFRPIRHNPANQEIAIRKNGRILVYQVHDQTLYKALAGGETYLHPVVKMLLTMPKELLRAGVTLDPKFMTGNIFRDQFTAHSQSKYGYTWGLDFARGLKSVLLRDDAYQLFLHSGGHGATRQAIIKLQQRKFERFIADLGKSRLRRFLETTVHPIRTLTVLGDFAEQSSRVGEFKLAIAQEGINEEGLTRSGLAARDVTQDFFRQGRTTRTLATGVPFLGANVGGVDNAVRAVKRNPARGLGMLAAIALLDILAGMLAKGNPDYEERKKERELYTLLPIGDPRTTQRWFRILKPYEQGEVATLMASAISGDAEMMRDMLPDRHTPMNMILNLLPQIAKPAIEAEANFDFFRRRQIDPQWELNREPYLRYDRYTSEVSKKLGRWMNISPRQIDHLIYGYTGWSGRSATDLLDEAVIKPLDDAIAVPDASKELLEWLPGVSRLFSQPLTAGRAWTITKLYERIDELQMVENSLKAMPEGDREAYRKAHAGVIEDAPKLKAAKEMLSDLRDAIDAAYAENLPPSLKRERLNALTNRMINVARDNYGLVSKMPREAADDAFSDTVLGQMTEKARDSMDKAARQAQIKDLVQQMRDTPDNAGELLDRARGELNLNFGEIQDIRRNATMDALEAKVRSTDFNVALTELAKSSPMDRARLGPVLEGRIRRASIDQTRKQQLLNRLALVTARKAG